MRAGNLDNSKDLAAAAIERFEEHRPYLLLNEVSATNVVGSRPEVDLEVFHSALDAWEGAVRLQLELVEEVHDELTKYIHQSASRLRRSGALKVVDEQWTSRNAFLNRSLDRIRNLRQTRPRQGP